MAERAGLLEGKNILVMGLLNTMSLAWSIGETARSFDANVIYTVQNEAFRKHLLNSFKKEGLASENYNILTCDVTKKGNPEASEDDPARYSDPVKLFKEIEAPLDGLVYSIAYANKNTCLRRTMLDAPSADIFEALECSAIGLSYTLAAAREKFTRGGSVVAMTFDSQRAYQNYSWMGVCKATLESLARDLSPELGELGVRINCLSAGPQLTMAARSIPSFRSIAEFWDERAPLGWDINKDREHVAGSAVYLLSDLSKKVTGTVHFVDGGFNSIAIPLQMSDIKSS